MNHYHTYQLLVEETLPRMGRTKIADCHLSGGNCSPSLMNLYYENIFGPFLNADSAIITKIIMHNSQKINLV